MHGRLDRRRFLEIGALTGGLSLGATESVLRAAQEGTAQVAPDPDDRVVRLSGDGLGLTAPQYARLLSQLADAGLERDNYSNGGVVEELEARFARLLGKERAVFMPTGTLANHLAVRTLAGGRGRVIVQAESHLYNDEGDCAQTLSRLNLVPLGAGRASFTAAEVEEVVARTRSGRVATPVSVISIESPVRRRFGERFDDGELARIVALAAQEGIRLHLDGARLFLQAAYTGVDVAEYARPFDTVYVSLYKYFNAASGAVLAGPRALLDGMFHDRRMFGGGLPYVWPYAAVALHYLDGFGDRFARAVDISETLVADLAARGPFVIDRIEPGTNLLRLRADGVAPDALRARLADEGVLLPAAQADGAFVVGVNETLLRSSAADLAEAFLRAVRA